MTPTTLRHLGDPYGYGWQTRLARDLKVDARSVRRWLAGHARITPQMATLIRQVIDRWGHP